MDKQVFNYIQSCLSNSGMLEATSELQKDVKQGEYPICDEITIYNEPQYDENHKLIGTPNEVNANSICAIFFNGAQMAAGVMRANGIPRQIIGNPKDHDENGNLLNQSESSQGGTQIRYYSNPLFPQGNEKKECNLKLK